eukprot:7753916-Prorocentrum_lima.AAC.1
MSTRFRCSTRASSVRWKASSRVKRRNSTSSAEGGPPSPPARGDRRIPSRGAAAAALALDGTEI